VHVSARELGRLPVLTNPKLVDPLPAIEPLYGAFLTVSLEPL